MFISQSFIDEIAKHNSVHIGVQIVGLKTEYFTLVDDGNGLASIETIVVNAEPGNDRDAPFKVDLALPTHVEGIFFLMKDLIVNSLGLVNRKDGTDLHIPAVCLAEHTDKIAEIMNAPRYGELVVVPKA